MAEPATPPETPPAVKANGKAAPEPALAPSGPPATMGTVRQRIQLRVGQLLLATARLPRYRELSVKTLMAALFEALQRDRIAFAEDAAKSDNGLIGMALWASVSPEVSEEIAAQIEAKRFPVLLKASDWDSGEIVWLLDLIVPSRKAGTAVFMNFSTLVGGRPFRLHPVVAGSVDPEIVAKINALASGTVLGVEAPAAKTPASKTRAKSKTQPKGRM